MAGILDDTYSGGLLDDPLLSLGIGLAAAGGPAGAPVGARTPSVPLLAGAPELAELPAREAAVNMRVSG